MTYLVAAILLALPIAAFLEFHIGRVESRRREYACFTPEQIRGGASLDTMIALLGLLPGFGRSSALGWREARQTALVRETMAIGTAFLTADLHRGSRPRRSSVPYPSLLKGPARGCRRHGRPRGVTTFLARTFAAQAEIWPAMLGPMEGASDPIRVAVAVAVARSVTDMPDAHTIRIATAAEQIPGPAKFMVSLVAVVAILIVENCFVGEGR